MIECLYEACSDECLGHDFRREETSQLFRSNPKSIRKVDDDLAVPLSELLRNILVSRKWDSEENHLRLAGVLKGLGNDSGTEFFLQRRKRLRSTGVCDCDFDVLACEDVCQ